MKVDAKLHAEILTRVKPLNLAPYSGFVYPTFNVQIGSDGKIKDIQLENKQTFIEQMLFYGKTYSFLN